MENTIQTWTEKLINKFGLEDYEINPTISREISSIKTTVYTLNMEFFPNGTIAEEDSNPPGTILIEVNLTYGILTRFCVVMEEDLRKNPPLLPSSDWKTITDWIEEHTTLKYKIDFLMLNEKKDESGTEYFFHSVLHERKVSPGGYIDIKVDKQGCIMNYSLYGFFHNLLPEITVEPATDQLIQDIDKIKEKQVILFGIMKDKQIQLLYGVDEIFVDGEMVLDDEIILTWSEQDSILEVPLTHGRIPDLWNAFYKSKLISEEEMKKNIPHPDSLVVTLEEQSEFLQVIINYLREHRQAESGNWKVEQIERHNGLLEATVVPIRVLDRITDKMKFTYDVNEHIIVLVMDKRELLELSGVMELPVLDLDVKISNEEAVKLLDKDIYFKPYYVYDEKRHSMKAKQMIDCHYFVDALTGEIISELY
ncbi:hypothetical protein [Psychrobacillus sp.]|uniref:hypothetical protein n=1 Tax=Psychrobacillus sp. TaxID=1871623 RepID=UPI0028BD387F|nr:hypothetical protein [Psychrobacillus sp.]